MLARPQGFENVAKGLDPYGPIGQGAGEAVRAIGSVTGIRDKVRNEALDLLGKGASAAGNYLVNTAYPAAEQGARSLLSYFLA